ncbi:MULTISPECIES: SDR family oxidoreductase [Rhizobium]|jgi:dihydroflavonol-4-reductase|uniref:SDR family oxidoreductase n=1 Tax=Rhizobium TaxID=379 RepID=UPI000DD563FC|nr:MULTISPECIES: aldehyde reductase [Rhizobium]NKJ08122.1 dihydroflavonol-4-reductase [Rhizobium sp. SG741]NKJ35029.1 dihydroflavonol-4-reductase [Rhizobium sp. SG570]NRP87415.1 UDP-glucose 4-epimerase [Ensifer adhaerens]NTJ11303.1 aldehyde reductase [Rhizobium lusitanum]
MSEELVLVTGGSGFIAQHCILALLEAGYRVRTTLRSLSREAEVLSNLRTGGAEPGDRLSFAAADLTADDGWLEAAADCAYIIHGASPTPSGDQVREEDWIRPAVDGNLRVLRAARDAGVRRVVLTSAFGAIGVGHKPRSRPFDETDWSDLNGNVAPYQRSKTLAERASWDFIAREGSGLELATVNPTTVLGPALGSDYSHSIRLIKNLLDGQPGCPKINTCVVDVRDVADLHLRAMTDPAANGERFLAASGESLWMVEIARLLNQRLGKGAKKVSTRVLPNWFIRVVALFNPAMKGIVPHLGVNMNASGDKAKRLLGWAPRSREDAIVATAESLIKLGLVNTTE